MTIIITILVVTSISFFLLASHVYGLPKRKLVLTFAFISLLSIQLSPISFFYAYEGNPGAKESFISDEIEKCKKKFNKPSFCEDLAKIEAKKEFDQPNFGLLFVLTLFILCPTAGVALIFAEVIFEQKLFSKPLTSKKLNKSDYLKAILRFLGSLTFLSFGFLIVWGFCLPPSHVPSQIKTVNLVVGLPLLMVVFVLIEAFGKAFAHSGVHSPQNVIVEFMNINKKEG
jgi:hypothetical protein